MDKFLASFTAEEDGDLMLCREAGAAYQKDRNHLVHYDEDYYAKCRSYEDQEIARKINAGRIELVSEYFGSGKVVDIGIGSGEFIKLRRNTYGYDINPVAIEWLHRNDLWAHPLDAFGAYTMWDVIEHLPVPWDYFRHIKLHAFLFASLPLFRDLDGIRQSRHYRPGEHLQYFTEGGFMDWMYLHGFRCLARETFEILAGREDIYSFAFKRLAWPM